MHAARRTTATRLSPLVLVILALAGCGGGGGGDAPPGNIDITAANQDAVTRASMVAVQGGLTGSSLGIAGGGQASPAGVAAGAAMRRLLAATLTAGTSGGRKAIAAVSPPQTLDCAVSGTATGTVDDRDNTGTLTVGDVLSLSFNACSDVAGEVLNGSMSATYTQIVQAPLTVGATVAVANLGFSQANYNASIDGAFSLTYSEPSATASTIRIVVPNALALRASTPAYSDTVTLLDGYTVDSRYDADALPPVGNVPGRTTTTASGAVASTVAGGFVRITTLQPMIQYDIDPYPRSGQLDVVGKNGSLQAVVLSTSQVQIDLDADGNGVFDGSKVVAWDQLL